MMNKIQLTKKKKRKFIDNTRPKKINTKKKREKPIFQNNAMALLKG